VKRDAMSADQPVVFYSAGKGRLSSTVDHVDHSCITSIPSTFSRYYDRRAGRATPVPACLICTLLAAYQDSECMSCLLRDYVDWVDSVRTRR